jgi:hypothetical protein
MSEEATVEPAPNFRDRLSGFFKILFCVAAFLLLMFTVLANMGGSSDALKGAVEDYISSATGYKASIGKFNNLSFFPLVVFDFENLDLKVGTADEPVITAGRVYFATGFWDVAWRSGKIKDFEIRDVHAQPGILTHKELAIGQLVLTSSVEGKEAALAGDGSIGPYALNVHMDMNVMGKGLDKKYTFPEDRFLRLNFGDIALTAIQKNAEETGIRLDDLKVNFKDKEFATGYLEFGRNTPRAVDISGALAFSAHNSDIKPEIRVREGTEKPLISGRITGETLHLDDFKPSSDFDALAMHLDDIFGPGVSIAKPQHSFSEVKVDVYFKQVFDGVEAKGVFDKTLSLQDAVPDMKKASVFITDFITGKTPEAAPAAP